MYHSRLCTCACECVALHVRGAQHSCRNCSLIFVGVCTRASALLLRNYITCMRINAWHCVKFRVCYCVYVCSQHAGSFPDWTLPARAQWRKLCRESWIWAVSLLPRQLNGAAPCHPHQFPWLCRARPISTRPPHQETELRSAGRAHLTAAPCRHPNWARTSTLSACLLSEPVYEERSEKIKRWADIHVCNTHEYTCIYIYICISDVYIFMHEYTRTHIYSCINLPGLFLEIGWRMSRYLGMNVYKYTCAFIYVYVMYAYTCINISKRKYSYIYIMYTHIYIYTNYMYIYIYIYVHICVYIYIYRYMIWIYMHIYK